MAFNITKTRQADLLLRGRAPGPFGPGHRRTAGRRPEDPLCRSDRRLLGQGRAEAGRAGHHGPHPEIPLVFQCWEKWLQDAGICDSLKDIDFIEVHAFGCQPKSPNPLVDPPGTPPRWTACAKPTPTAYQAFFRDYLPENGVPARFTVHLLDVPDKAASYEFYSTALYQKALQKKGRHDHWERDES